jgi:hypothetical protein
MNKDQDNYGRGVPALAFGDTVLCKVATRTFAHGVRGLFEIEVTLIDHSDSFSARQSSLPPAVLLVRQGRGPPHSSHPASQASRRGIRPGRE